MGCSSPMGERRIEELKLKLATLNASIARLAAIGVELSQNLAEAESRRIQHQRGLARRKKLSKE